VVEAGSYIDEEGCAYQDLVQACVGEANADFFRIAKEEHRSTAVADLLLPGECGDELVVGLLKSNRDRSSDEYLSNIKRGDYGFDFVVSERRVIEDCAEA
jgi:hypothetical protein